MNKGVEWSEQTLFEYLENPKKVRIPLSEMLRRLTAPLAVYSWNQDGLRWLEEGEGQERPRHIP